MDAEMESIYQTITDLEIRLREKRGMMAQSTPLTYQTSDYDDRYKEERRRVSDETHRKPRRNLPRTPVSYDNDSEIDGHSTSRFVTQRKHQQTHAQASPHRNTGTKVKPTADVNMRSNLMLFQKLALQRFLTMHVASTNPQHGYKTMYHNHSSSI